MKEMIDAVHFSIPSKTPLSLEGEYDE